MKASRTLFLVALYALGFLLAVVLTACAKPKTKPSATIIFPPMPLPAAPLPSRPTPAPVMPLPEVPADEAKDCAVAGYPKAVHVCLTRSRGVI